LPHLFLYGRPGCHLCEEMRAGLQRLQAELDFTFATIDIDSSSELEQRYGLLVPALVLGSEEICHHQLDPDALRLRLGYPPTTNPILKHQSHNF